MRMKMVEVSKKILWINYIRAISIFFVFLSIVRRFMILIVELMPLSILSMSMRFFSFLAIYFIENNYQVNY